MSGMQAEPLAELSGQTDEDDELDVPGWLDRRAYPEAFEALWREYQPIASKNAAKGSAFELWGKLSAADKEACGMGLVRYVEWCLEGGGEERNAKRFALFIAERGWEAYEEKDEAPERARAEAAPTSNPLADAPVGPEGDLNHPLADEPVGAEGDPNNPLADEPVGVEGDPNHPLHDAPVVAAAIERLGLLDGLKDHERLHATRGLGAIERVLRQAAPEAAASED